MGDGDGGNPTESAGNLQEWVQLLREYRGDGTKTCGNTAGMEIIAGEIHGVCLENTNHTVFMLRISASVDVKYLFAAYVAWKNMHSKTTI